MRYTTKRIKNGYELENELGQPAGSISFNIWSMSKAKATIAQQEYDFYSVGFWQTKKVMARNGITVAEMAYKLGNGFEISFSGHSRLILKKKSFWTSGEYILVDENNTVFASLTMAYSWKRWAYNYEIEIQENMFHSELKSILPVILFYAAMIMLRMRQAAA